MEQILNKRILVLVIGLLVFSGWVQAQEQLLPLNGNDVLKNMHRHLPKQQKSTQFINYEPVLLPFIDDFSNYTGYPDTALWIGRQAYVNQSFAVAPPTIGCVTLDAVNERGLVYAHANTVSFSADTLLSRPIRLDSIFSPYPMSLRPADSVYFSFFYQPGGGIGKQWNLLGDAPETDDSLLLDFGYQTGNIVLLYYITNLQTVADTVFPNDTLYSYCNPDLYIIADNYLFPGDKIEVPCDSVNGMEIIWKTVWQDQGRTLQEFINLYQDTFRQVMIPITDSVYFNRGFQFRFRNYASIGLDNNVLCWGNNQDYWNIDYVRLNTQRKISDTTIDDIAFVNNPGSILKNYTAMPWEQFKDNQKNELIDTFNFIKLTNLSSATKMTKYRYNIWCENQIIGYDSGGNQNLPPVYSYGYQTWQKHTRPTLVNPLTIPAPTSDSVLLLIQHVFEEESRPDKNPKNDTVVYAQKFYNYYAYDDGTPEAGYILTSSTSPFRKSLALEFTLNKPDTLRAIDIYLNSTMNEAAFLNFTLMVWKYEGDAKGMPGKELYSQEVKQEYSLDLYGFQRFYLAEPLPVSGTFFIGYQIAGHNRLLNIGFDQNTDAHKHTFWRTNNNRWDSSFLVGSPMLRPVLGQYFPYVGVVEQPTSIDVKLYPNPAKDILHIFVPDEIRESDMTLAIYTVTGQKIYEHAYQSEISLSGFAAGFYILRLTDNKNNINSVRKFSVVR